MSCVQDTPSVALSVALGTLTAALKLSADAGNVAVVHADGLYVGGPDVSVPAGAMIEYGALAAPTGWLLCDGSAVSRSIFSVLFSKIGTTYGPGDGSTTFNVPNFGRRVGVTRLAGDPDFGSLGAVGGESTHVLTAAEFQHFHGLTNTNTIPDMGVADAAAAPPTNTNGVTLNSPTAHNNLQPFLTIQKIIKT